jgi:hypothetical protein
MARLSTARAEGAQLRQLAIVARLRALASLQPDVAAIRALADMLEQEVAR